MDDQKLDEIYFRLKQLEEHRREKTKTSILAEFYTAEYAIIMGRISTWENLQYVAWLILAAVLTLVAQMNQIALNGRLWAAVLLTLLVYVVYLGTMANMLYYVLLIERYLRPRAALLVETDNFWIHEIIRHKTFPYNPGWSAIWSVAFSLSTILCVAIVIWKRCGFNWVDYVCIAGAFSLCLMVAMLAASGRQLKAQINDACRQSDIDIIDQW